MLQALLAYARGAAVDTRWLVLTGDAEFFSITKRLHNMLHGSTGDGGEMGETEHRRYQAVLRFNEHSMAQLVKAGDIVILHDPQTAGLVKGMQELGAHVVWRCHVGADVATEVTDRAWEFLRSYASGADAFIFTREEYSPAWVPRDSLWVIPPSLDPFSAKNAELTPGGVAASLGEAGLVAKADSGPRGDLHFRRRDGSAGWVRRHTGLLQGEDPIPADARVVLQVSRWDRLKDMTGVLTSFTDAIDTLPGDAHLLLVGPDVAGVTDDPEGAEVLEECLSLWKALPEDAARRVHLGTIPMDDVDENAHLINALQAHATVVVQKSLMEGFGLTVTEPMWKGKPVLASAIGGIRDQIVDGEHGLLLEDPFDLVGFSDGVRRLLVDTELASRLGGAAKERVLEVFLGDRHLIQYVELFADLIETEERSTA